MKWTLNRALVASIVLGLASGVLRAALLSAADAAEFAASLHHFALTFQPQDLGAAALPASLLRYGRALVLIWACAAFARAYYAGFLVLYLRAMALGFSAAMLVATFGGGGFLYAMSLYGLQNLVIMPVYVYTISFIARHNLALATRATDDPAAVIKLAALGLGLVVAVSAIEVFVAPYLFDALRR